MIKHSNIKDLALKTMLRSGEITMAGNIQLRIYGTLRCRSGKRLKRSNRIFFNTEAEAKANGYRPCGHCMKPEYNKWKHGIVHYYGRILKTSETSGYMERLLRDIPWKNDEAVIFGRHIITKRKVAWFGDSEFNYTYSGKTRQALPWTDDLLQLKQLVETVSGETFNSCLLNLYHNGDEGMAWHSDDEKTMAKDSAIASLSLGAERKFSLRHKISKETISLQLENGSLLVMKGTTQTHWLHSIPKTKSISQPRINLTFRTFNL